MIFQLRSRQSKHVRKENRTERNRREKKGLHVGDSKEWSPKKEKKLSKRKKAESLEGGVDNRSVMTKGPAVPGVGKEHKDGEKMESSKKNLKRR